MSDKDKTGEHQADDEALAKLLKLAGPRADIPGGAEKRVYSRVLAEWEKSSQTERGSQAYNSVLRAWQRRNSFLQIRRWLLPIGVAAAAAFAMVVVVQPEAPPRVGIATVSKVIARNGDASLPEFGATLYAGDRLITGPDDGISLQLNRGESLRIDVNSEIRLDAGNRMTLVAGQIYADTGDLVYRDRGLIIDTSFGTVKDIGTQFAVTTDSTLLDVAVREGRVDVQQGEQEHVAIAGERLLVRRDGSAEMLTVSPDSDYWSWASRLAPVYTIDGKSLLDFLKWVSRETGMRLEFPNDDVRLAAMRTDLHGSIGNVGPLDALDAVVTTTAFRYRIDGGRIVVDR